MNKLASKIERLGAIDRIAASHQRAFSKDARKRVPAQAQCGIGNGFPGKAVQVRQVISGDLLMRCRQFREEFGDNLDIGHAG